MRITKQRGFTLIELILAMALFVALAGGLSYAIIRGLRAHEFETAYREASVSARNALDRLTEEMRTGYPILDVYDKSNGKNLVPSAVWFPDSYGSTGSPFSKYDEKVVNVTGKNSTKAHVAYNRIIFTRPNPEKGLSSVDKLEGYVYVDWFIPTDKPNRLYRVVHTVNSDSYKTTPTMINGWSLYKYELASPDSYFGAGSGSVGKNLAYTTTNVSDYIVAQLPGDNDVLSFAASHEPIRGVYSYASTEGAANANGASYEPSLFKIRIKASVYTRGVQKVDKNDTDAFGGTQDSKIDATNPNKRVVTFTEEVLVKQR